MQQICAGHKNCQRERWWARFGKAIYGVYQRESVPPEANCPV